MQTWLTDVAGSALPHLRKAKMLYCILRILLIWNISQSCSNLLQPTVTNCCFLRKSELVQFTSNRKCIQGWDSADFPCCYSPSKQLLWVKMLLPYAVYPPSAGNCSFQGRRECLLSCLWPKPLGLQFKYLFCINSTDVCLMCFGGARINSSAGRMVKVAALFLQTGLE